MLETRRLGEQTRHFAVWGKATWLPLFLVLLISLLCLSMILGMYWPQAERHKSRKIEQYQAVQKVLSNLPKQLGPESLIDGSIDPDVNAWLLPLREFRDASSPKSDTNPARDPQTFLGRVNLIVDDLQILRTAHHLILNQKRLLDELAVSDALTRKRYPDGSAAKGFQWASQSWIAAEKSNLSTGSITWKALEDGKPLWQHMLGQLAAVEMELQALQGGGRKQAAKELWDSLTSHGQLEQLRRTDAMYSQILLAKERLSILLKDFPQPPTEEAPSNRMWQWLIFPGTLSEGLVLMGISLGMLFFMQLAYQMRHRAGMKKLADDWLRWSAGQEVKIRKAVPVIETLQTSVERMADGLGVLAESLLQAGQGAQTQADEEHLAHSWQGVHKLELDISQDVQLTREKLLNVHTQFCSGATRENLIYDMAYIAQALETVEAAVQTLSRHLNLLSKKSMDTNALTAQEVTSRLGSDVLEFQRQLQALTKDISAIEGLIDVAVEDVPPSLRFEGMPRYDASGRRIEASN